MRPRSRMTRLEQDVQDPNNLEPVDSPESEVADLLDGPNPGSTPPEPALRERILREATRLFASQGYGSTSMRVVAAAVGCTKPALYYYFTNKEVLFEACLRKPFHDYALLLEATSSAPGDLRSRLHAIFDQVIQSVGQDPMAMRLVFTTVLRPEPGQPANGAREAHCAAGQILIDLIATAAKKGEVRRDVSPEILARFFTGVMLEHALALMDGDPVPPELGRQLIEVYFNGVKP
jgi:AcrR family transcriptional regulator